MNSEEIVERAAVAFGPEQGEHVEALFTDVEAANVSGTVEDQLLEQDDLSRKKEFEAFSPEEALERRYGNTFFSYINEQIADAKAALKKWLQNVDSALEEMTKFDERRREHIHNSPAIWESGAMGAFFFICAIAAVVFETELLVGPLARWLPKTAGSVVAAGAILLAFLSIMAHQALFASLPLVRALWGLAGLSTALFLGWIRAYSCVSGGSPQAFYSAMGFWTMMTVAAPVATALLLELARKYLHPCFEVWESNRKWLADRKALQEKVAAAKAEVQRWRDELRRLLGEFKAAKDAMLAEEDARLGNGRSAKRALRCEVAMKMISWRFFQTQSQKQPVHAQFTVVQQQPQPQQQEKKGLPRWVWILLCSLVAAALFSGCANPLPPQEKKLHVAIVCDRSSSSETGLACSNVRLAGICTGVAEEAARRDVVLDIVLMHKSMSDAQVIFHKRHSGGFSSPVEEEEFKSRIVTECKELDLPVLAGLSSNIVDSLYRAKSLFREEDENRLFLISDMRHIGGGFDFERTIPSPETFIASLDVQGEMNFRGASLSACGFNTGSPNKPFDRELHSELENLWPTVFEHWKLGRVQMMEECEF